MHLSSTLVASNAEAILVDSFQGFTDEKWNESSIFVQMGDKDAILSA